MVAHKWFVNALVNGTATTNVPKNHGYLLHKTGYH